MTYDDRPEDLREDTKTFLKSEYGQYLMAYLASVETAEVGNITNPKNVSLPHSAGSLKAIKEVIQFIQSPLDDDTPLRG